jgi:Holliday junction resolvase
MSRRRRKEREYAKEFNNKGENHLRVIEGGAVTKPRQKDVSI